MTAPDRRAEVIARASEVLAGACTNPPGDMGVDGRAMFYATRSDELARALHEVLAVAGPEGGAQ